MKRDSFHAIVSFYYFIWGNYYLIISKLTKRIIFALENTFVFILAVTTILAPPTPWIY